MFALKKIIVLVFAVLIVLTSACSSTELAIPVIPDSAYTEYVMSRVFLEPYSDLTEMGIESLSDYVMIHKNGFKPEDIYTYSFDMTFFEGADDILKDVMEAGRNPGLGVKSLHEKGITGKGVNVAIIDQNLLTEHPEYKENVAKYYPGSFPEEYYEYGSMHGPAVLSFLAGKTCGVAPDAKVYFACGAMGQLDAEPFAKALYWIIEENEKLPENEKIRVVSVSAAPEEGYMENAELWTEAVAAAQKAGMLVLDCRTTDEYTGFIHSAYYDPEDPENIKKCRPLYPDMETDFSNAYYKTYIYALSNYRTSARAYEEGKYFYGYDGIGGQSWAVPYVAGVLALGWQINPEITAEDMRELLISNCYIEEHGLRMVDPIAFIEAVENTL